MTTQCPRCHVELEPAHSGHCPACGAPLGYDSSPPAPPVALGPAAPAVAPAPATPARTPLWPGLMALVLAATFLATAILVRPGERGSLVMSGGRGRMLTPQENTEFLEKLRDAGYNVPPEAIQQSRRQAAGGGTRRTLAQVSYALSGASFLVAVVSLLQAGAWARIVNRTARRTSQ